MNETGKIKIRDNHFSEPKKQKDSRSRSELTLLWELIQRNPERAREFLERLRRSMKAA